MALRAHWKGFLKLSFVSCPVALYPVIAAEERLSFRRLNRRTGHRLRQQLVDAVTGEVVQSSESGRGYEIGDNQFLTVDEEDVKAAEREARERPFALPRAPAAELSAPRSDAPDPLIQPATSPRAGGKEAEPARHEAEPVEPITEEPSSTPPARIENNRTIEIDRFLPRAQLDPVYFQTPYYIAPRDEVGQEAFAVIRDAMCRQEVVAMGRVVLARRERPIIMEPLGRGLRGITLRFAHEIRASVDYFAGIPEIRLPEEMLRIAEHIVETKTGAFDRAYLEDRYRTVMIEKLKEKHAARPRQAPVIAPARENIINLMDALKRSLGKEKMPPERSVRRRASAAKPRRSRR